MVRQPSHPNREMVVCEMVYSSRRTGVYPGYTSRTGATARVQTTRWIRRLRRAVAYLLLICTGYVRLRIMLRLIRPALALFLADHPAFAADVRRY